MCRQAGLEQCTVRVSYWRIQCVTMFWTPSLMVMSRNTLSMKLHANHKMRKGKKLQRSYNHRCAMPASWAGCCLVYRSAQPKPGERGQQWRPPPQPPLSWKQQQQHQQLDDTGELCVGNSVGVKATEEMTRRILCTLFTPGLEESLFSFLLIWLPSVHLWCMDCHCCDCQWRWCCLFH